MSKPWCTPEGLASVERFDVLEKDLPRGICSVRDCHRGEPVYPLAGPFGTRWLCSRHRPVWRAHYAIVERIRSL